MTLRERARNAWDAFRAKKEEPFRYTGAVSETRNPQRTPVSSGSERSIANSILTRIAIDASMIDIKHVRVDEDGRFLEHIDDSLNRALTFSANLDQTGRAMMQDAIMSMFDEGEVAVVPTVTDSDPETGSEAWSVIELRVGKIVGWRPDEVDVKLYNPKTGQRVTLPFKKTAIAIVQNPWYTIMNEPNSMLNRLIRKLKLLDKIDELNGSNKLDILIQLPYDVSRDVKRKEAEARKEAITDQLKNSEFGIAYTGATERITQLNRPAENNLLAQIESLMLKAFGQYGMTQSILDGTADEATMKNYTARILGPTLLAFTEEFTRKYISATAYAQGGRVMYFVDPFAFTTASNLAEISDKFTRNAIMSTNEVRAEIGLKPSDDPDADALRNKNLNPPELDETIRETPISDKETE